MKALNFLLPNSNKLKREDIYLFTNNLEIKLSNEFIEFLNKFNGGELLSRIYFQRIFEDGFKQKLRIDFFYNFEQIKADFEVFYNQLEETDFIDNQILAFATTTGSTLICLGINDKNFGQIFLWDGDFGVTKQAENLELFFDSLELDEKESK